MEAAPPMDAGRRRLRGAARRVLGEVRRSRGFVVSRPCRQSGSFGASSTVQDESPVARTPSPFNLPQGFLGEVRAWASGGGVHEGQPHPAEPSPFHSGSACPQPEPSRGFAARPKNLAATPARARPCPVEDRGQAGPCTPASRSFCRRLTGGIEPAPARDDSTGETTTTPRNPRYTARRRRGWVALSRYMASSAARTAASGSP